MSREGHCPHGNKLKRSTDVNKSNQEHKTHDNKFIQ